MFRIISSFLKACDEDVLKLMCGKTRVGAVEGAKHLHFHLDRALQLACNQVTYYLVSGALIVTIPRQDREQLCPRAQVGEGGVYM